MKKLFVLVLAIFCVTTMTQAQSKGEMSVGAQVAFGSGDSYSNVGIGAKFRYNVIDNLRIEPSFTYFLEKDYLSMWDISANAHYLFPVGSRFTLYPLAGLSVMGVKADVGDHSASDSEFGINLGGGVDFDLTHNLVLNGELKYKVGGDWSRLIIGIGVAYKF